MASRTALAYDGCLAEAGCGKPHRGDPPQKRPSTKPSTYLFVVIESDHAHVGLRGQRGRGCTGVDQSLFGGIKGILFTRPSSRTLPPNTWEVHAPGLPSVVMARMMGWGSDWPSSLMTLPGMWETFSAGLGEPPSGCPIPAHGKSRRMNKMQGKSGESGEVKHTTQSTETNWLQ